MKFGVLSSVTLLLAACTRVHDVPVHLSGHDLVMDGTGEAVFAAVEPGEGVSAASVRRVHTLTRSDDGSLAGVLISLNRAHFIVLIRYRGREQLSFSSALTVPVGADMVFRDDGSGLLVVSTRDRYLPVDSDFRANRGAMFVAPSRLAWFDDLELALTPERRDPRWYADAGSRFEAEGDFELTGLCWTPDGCEVGLAYETGGTRSLELH